MNHFINCLLFKIESMTWGLTSRYFISSHVTDILQYSWSYATFKIATQNNEKKKLVKCVGMVYNTKQLMVCFSFQFTSITCYPIYEGIGPSYYGGPPIIIKDRKSGSDRDILYPIMLLCLFGGDGYGCFWNVSNFILIQLWKWEIWFYFKQPQSIIY